MIDSAARFLYPDAKFVDANSLKADLYRKFFTIAWTFLSRLGNVRFHVFE